MWLEAKNISFAYDDRPILQEFSLTIEPGKFTMLLGPNGSGKSTALKLLAGLLQPCSGQLLLDNQPLAKYPARERARQIAVVPQSAPPTLDFTVREMVMMGRHARLARLAPPSAEDWYCVGDAMNKLDVAKLENRPCNRLSGGERQRVAIAAALAQRPRFLLLDEPTSALDPAHALRVMELLAALPDRPGILMITHNLQLALRYAEELLLLHQGRTHASGPPEEVLRPENVETVYRCPSRIIQLEPEGQCIYLAPPTISAPRDASQTPPPPPAQ